MFKFSCAKEFKQKISVKQKRDFLYEEELSYINKNIPGKSDVKPIEDLDPLQNLDPLEGTNRLEYVDVKPNIASINDSTSVEQPANETSLFIVHKARTILDCPIEDQRAVVKFLWAKRYTAETIRNQMLPIYAANCMPLDDIKYFLQRFESGRISLENYKEEGLAEIIIRARLEFNKRKCKRK